MAQQGDTVLFKFAAGVHSVVGKSRKPRSYYHGRSDGIWQNRLSTLRVLQRQAVTIQTYLQ